MMLKRWWFWLVVVLIAISATLFMGKPGGMSGEYQRVGPQGIPPAPRS